MMLPSNADGHRLATYHGCHLLPLAHKAEARIHRMKNGVVDQDLGWQQEQGSDKLDPAASIISVAPDQQRVRGVDQLQSPRMEVPSDLDGFVERYYDHYYAFQPSSCQAFEEHEADARRTARSVEQEQAAFYGDWMAEQNAGGHDMEPESCFDKGVGARFRVLFSQ